MSALPLKQLAGVATLATMTFPSSPWHNSNLAKALSATGG
jgi:hypothetical protein